MGEGELEVGIIIENEEDLRTILNSFSPQMKFGLYRSLQHISNRKEKELKGTTGFKDRTGKLRRSLFVTATFNPLGIEMGSFSPYAIYVAEGHGTWPGSFWRTFIDRAIPQIHNSLKKALSRVVDKFNRGEV